MAVAYIRTIFAQPDQATAKAQLLRFNAAVSQIRVLEGVAIVWFPAMEYYWPWMVMLPIPPFTSRSTRLLAVLKSAEMYSLLIRV